MKKNTSWNEVSEWYNDTVLDPDSYQQKVVLPNLLRIVNVKKGETVLDLACGQGFFSDALAKAGAKVLGIDISSKLIEIAKQNTSKDISYHVSSAENLQGITDNSIDAVVCVLALQNIENISKVFKECRRVLRKNGKCVFVLNHPVLRIPQKTTWGFDEKAKIQYRKIDGYLSESRHEIIMNPGKKDGEKTISFHRPLQVYVKNLANAGFAVIRLEEWISHKVSEDGPRKDAEDKARKEFPLFMCLECVVVENYK